MKAVKETERKYYKYQYNDFVQPVLTSNGVIGGDSFAVKLSEETDGKYAYYGFDGKADTHLRTGYVQPQWLLMYNPRPLNVSKIEYILTDDSFWATSLDIQASTDGSDDSWVTLLSLDNLKLQNYIWDIDTGGESYKYYRLYIKSASRPDTQYSPRPAQISELKLTAQEQTVVESSESDYDFYEDIDTYKLPSKIDRKYYKIVDGEQTTVNLYDSNNQTYIDSSTYHFVVGGVTAWSTTQIYNLNHTISAKDITIITTGNIQANAGWTIAIDCTTDQGETNILTKDFGYGIAPEITSIFDLGSTREGVNIKSIKIYVYCYRRSTSYCYGGIDIKLAYTPRQVKISTQDNHDFYEDKITYYGIGE